MSAFSSLLSLFFLLSPLLEASLKESCFWSKMHLEEERLQEEIGNRLSFIASLKETLRPLIKEDSPLALDFFTTLKQGDLLLHEEGCGSAYLVLDKEKKPLFILKPSDEEIGCLHNPKRYASCLEQEEAPSSYLSALREVLCYEIAKLLGLESLLAPSTLVIVSHPSFFLQEDALFLLTSKEEAKEKLCSLQEYLTGMTPLTTSLARLFAKNLNDGELKACFDQEEFEQLCLLLWVTGDTDGHLGNFLTYPKGKRHEGLPLYGLRKIDNAQTFPEKKTRPLNLLMYLPNAQDPLSLSTRERLFSFSLSKAKELLNHFLLDKAYPLLQARVTLLLDLLQDPLATPYTISLSLIAQSKN